MDIRIHTDADSCEFGRLYALYRSIFTDEDEAEDLEGIKASLALVGDPVLVGRYGEFHEYWVEAVEDGEVLGGVNFTSFELPSKVTAHINYLFASERSRHKGVGTMLLGSVREISQADYLFCEQNDPSLMSEAELEEDRLSTGISPDERIRWWQRRGFARLDMHYVQPPLSSDKTPAEGMSLNVCPALHESLDAAIVEAHLRRFYYISVLKNRVPSDPATEKILEEVGRMGRISLVR